MVVMVASSGVVDSANHHCIWRYRITRAALPRHRSPFILHPLEVNHGELIVIALRLIVPLLILRYPLAGGLAAMLLDGLDVVLIEFIPGGSFGGHYHTLDKLLDSYYLTLELVVALRWKNPYARRPAVVLFAYRAVGVLLFELTRRRIMLFLFPNIFENWWLYCVVVARFWPRLSPHSVKSVVIPLLLLLIPKMAQEYVLHYAEAQPWNRFKKAIGWDP